MRAIIHPISSIFTKLSLISIHMHLSWLALISSNVLSLISGGNAVSIVRYHKHFIQNSTSFASQVPLQWLMGTVISVPWVSILFTPWLVGDVSCAALWKIFQSSSIIYIMQVLMCSLWLPRAFWFMLHLCQTRGTKEILTHVALAWSGWGERFLLQDKLSTHKKSSHNHVSEVT